MAHHVEPMDIDGSVCDFDDKENSFHHNNVLPRSPCTEKGYEELDVSELNMKLRYSITPTASPMSKSYTANFNENRNCEPENSTLDNANGNMTRSLHSTLTKNDSIVKSQKVLPLQALSTDHGHIIDGSRNALRPLDSTVTLDNNVKVTISGPNDNDENISLPSSSSSMAHTPEATTPTKDMGKGEEGSPIIRGLKSVLSMFRPSQSPIPPAEDETISGKHEAVSPPIIHSPDTSADQAVSASTPLVGQKTRDPLARRNSPNRDSLVFNDDLEKELNWKDDTIIFSKEKIPIHKLFFQQSKPEIKPDMTNTVGSSIANENKLDDTVEYMEVSYNESGILDKTAPKVTTDVLNKTETITTESDSEFVDAESTFTKNESLLEQSFKSQENDSLTSTEMLSEPNVETMEPPNLNATIETLSADLSATSTETARPENISSEILPTLLEGEAIGNEMKISSAELTSCVQETVNIVESIPDDIKVDQKQIHTPSLPTEIKDTHVNDNVINSPTLNNVVVSSLSEIPLIADPRVLLFNIPSENDRDEKDDKVTDDVLNTSPADIPLPDDDDIEKLSSLPTLTAENVEPAVENQEATLQNDLILDNKAVTDVTETEAGDQTCTRNENKSIVEEITPVPEDKSVEKSKLMDIEPLDIIMSEAQGAAEVNVTEVISENTANEESCVPKLEHISKTTLPELVKIEEKIGNDKVRHDEEASRQHGEETVSFGSVAGDLLSNVKSLEKLDSKIAENIKDNMEYIKQEVEALVEAAIDIVIDKTTTVPNDPEVINEATIPMDTQPSEMAKSTEINVPQPKELLPELIKDVVQEKQQSHCSLEAAVAEDTNKIADIVQSNVEANEDVASLTKQSNKCQEVGDIFRDISNNTNKIHNTPETFTHIADITVASDVQSAVRTKEGQDDESPELNATQTIVNCDLNTTQVVAEIDKLLSETVVKKEKPMDISLENNTDRGNKIEISDEELVISESSSPFELISADNQFEDVVKPVENFEEIENLVAPTNEISTSPPLSPKIVSKGYNLNFDEIDDPFATKVKIRASPPPGATPNNSFEQINTAPELPKIDFNKNNRRKSQPDKRKPPGSNKRLNATFAGSSKVDTKANKEAKNKQTPKVEKTEPEQPIVGEDLTSEVVEDKIPITKDTNIDADEADKSSTINSLDKTHDAVEMLKSEDNVSSAKPITIAVNENKQTPSSEHSTYYSAGASSSEGTELKNSFNIPEIDDPNFNPFASKSKIRQSPPPGDIDPFATKSKIRQSPPPTYDADPFSTKSKMRNSLELSESELTNQSTAMSIDSTEPPKESERAGVVQEEKDSSNDNNNTTASSKSDKVNTEDEDTVEGPFLEADDLNNDEKMMDFNSENDEMMQFSELPPGNEENTEAGEMFIDAEAFEFLLNQNKASTIADSGKESLFLKFDPLFAKRVSSDGVMAALKNIQKRQSTPTKAVSSQTNGTFENLPVAGPSTFNATQDLDMNSSAEESFDDLNITVSKPMMVVNPAVNPVVTTRNKSITPVRTNRQSLTFTSPAIAVIDRLLCMSANNSYAAHDSTIADVRRDNEADLALTQLRELLADKEISVYNLRSESKELKDRLSTLESQVKNLESIGEDRLKKINELTEKLNEKTKINKSMAKVVEEYERTIASLIAETEQDKKRHAEERIQLIKERDEQTAHLASMEVSFSDLHSKYEKSKQVILGFKANEDSYKKSIKDFEENLAKMQNNYELLKQHATSKLNHANEELQKINRSHEAEVLKLNAMIKRKELHITSLEETLQQKTKANEELTAICDELINKVG